MEHEGYRHAVAWPRHPGLSLFMRAKSWMPTPAAARGRLFVGMTRWALSECTKLDQLRKSQQWIKDFATSYALGSRIVRIGTVWGFIRSLPRGDGRATKGEDSQRVGLVIETLFARKRDLGELVPWI